MLQARWSSGESPKRGGVASSFYLWIIDLPRYEFLFSFGSYFKFIQERIMKKVLAVLIASVFVAGSAMAQAPAAGGAGGAGAAGAGAAAAGGITAGAIAAAVAVAAVAVASVSTSGQEAVVATGTEPAK